MLSITPQIHSKALPAKSTDQQPPTGTRSLFYTIEVENENRKMEKNLRNLKEKGVWM